MEQYHITLASKNEKSIKKFFKFFNKIIKTFNIIKKYLIKKKKIKILAILKAPHVAKTAQEHFETRLFKKQITIYYSQKNLQFLILLKKIKIYLFSDIGIKTQFAINKMFTRNAQLKIINIDNFTLNFLNKAKKNKYLKKLKPRIKTKKKLSIKQTKHMLRLLDTYGNLLKTRLNSSAGRAKD